MDSLILPRDPEQPLFEPRTRSRIVNRMIDSPLFFDLDTRLHDLEDPSDFTDNLVFNALANPLVSHALDLGVFYRTSEISETLGDKLDQMDELRVDDRWFSYLNLEGVESYGRFVFSTMKLVSKKPAYPNLAVGFGGDRGIGPDQNLFSKKNIRTVDLAKETGLRVDRRPNAKDLLRLAKKHVDRVQKPARAEDILQLLKEDGFTYRNRGEVTSMIKQEWDGGVSSLNLSAGAVSFRGEGADARSGIEDWATEVVRQNGNDIRVLTGDTFAYLKGQGIGIGGPALRKHVTLAALRDIVSSRLQREQEGTDQRRPARTYEHIDFSLPGSLMINFLDRELAIDWGVELLLQNRGDSSVLSRAVLDVLAAEGRGPRASTIAVADHPSTRSSLFDSFTEFRDEVTQSYSAVYNGCDEQQRRLDSLSDIETSVQKGDLPASVIYKDDDLESRNDEERALHLAAQYYIVSDLTGSDEIAASLHFMRTAESLSNWLRRAYHLRVFTEYDIEEAAERLGVYDDFFRGGLFSDLKLAVS